MGNFLTRYRTESIWDRRGAIAFLLASVLPVLAYSLSAGENFLGAMLFGLGLAYAHLLLLGLPLAAWFNLRRKISLLTSALGAAFVGLLPWAVFIGWSLLHGTTPMDGKAVVALIFSFCFFGGMGFFAGVVWWFIATPQRGDAAAG